MVLTRFSGFWVIPFQFLVNHRCRAVKPSTVALQKGVKIFKIRILGADFLSQNKGTRPIFLFFGKKNGLVSLKTGSFRHNIRLETV